MALVSDVPDEVRGELSGIASRVRDQRIANVESAIESGRLLEEARQILANRGNGIFKTWVETACGLSESTAKRFMRAYRKFGERATVARTFELGALHVLSSPSCPREAVDAAERIAASGQVVTQRTAKELAKKYAPEKVEYRLTAIELVHLIRKSIWTVWQQAPNHLRPLVVPRFRGFLEELEETGDLSW